MLHTPRNAHGIDQTNWIMADRRRVLAEKGHRGRPQVMRRIIRDAGYTWKKARKVLTSTDPEYQEKLAKHPVHPLRARPGRAVLLDR